MYYFYNFLRGYNYFKIKTEQKTCTDLPSDSSSGNRTKCSREFSPEGQIIDDFKFRF